MTKIYNPMGDAVVSLRQRFKVMQRGLKVKKSFFVPGEIYYAHCMSGQAEKTQYRCVYVSQECVIFVFRYQGRERPHIAYHNDIKVGDYVLKRMSDLSAKRKKA